MQEYKAAPWPAWGWKGRCMGDKVGVKVENMSSLLPAFEHPVLYLLYTSIKYNTSLVMHPAQLSLTKNILESYLW